MSDPDDRDLLAAEYVLGTLDAGERADVASRLDRDVDLARAVQAWEHRLAPLADAVQPLAPPGAVYDGIVARLFPRAAAANDAPGEGSASLLRRRLRRWQAATGAFALLAASLLAWVAVWELPATSDTRRFTAVLQQDAGAPAMVVDVDLRARRLTVRPLASAAPAGHSYELWIIDPALGTPRSLGLVPASTDGEESLSTYDTAVITGATYAVTVEPSGGSPTGLPTAAPVLTGKLSPSRS